MVRHSRKQLYLRAAYKALIVSRVRQLRMQYSLYDSSDSDSSSSSSEEEEQEEGAEDVSMSSISSVSSVSTISSVHLSNFSSSSSDSTSSISSGFSFLSKLFRARLRRLIALEQGRYLVPRTHSSSATRPTPTLWGRLQTLRLANSEDEIVSLIRISSAAFDVLLAKLETHPLFAVPRRGKAASAGEQLVVVLYRFGREGEGASVKRIANETGTSVGSVVNFTRKVVCACVDLREESIEGVRDEEIQQAKTWVGERSACEAWRDGWAVLDALEVPLDFDIGISSKRAVQHKLGIKFLVLPHSLRVVHYVAGTTASRQRAMEQGNSTALARAPPTLNEDEFIWTYPSASLHRGAVALYPSPSASQDHAAFNHVATRILQRASLAKAYLRGRFPQLKNLRKMLGMQKEEEEEEATRLSVAMLVLHNVAMRFDSEETRARFIREGAAEEEGEGIEELQDVWSTDQQAQRTDEAALALRAQTLRRNFAPQSDAALDLSEEVNAEKHEARERREALHVALFESRVPPRAFETSREERMGAA